MGKRNKSRPKPNIHLEPVPVIPEEPQVIEPEISAETPVAEPVPEPIPEPIPEPAPEPIPEPVKEAAETGTKIIESAGMEISEDPYADIVENSQVGNDSGREDLSSTRELRFEMFTEEFDKKFREMFSDSLDNEDRKLGVDKLSDITVEREPEEISEPPAWAPPSTIEQHAKQVKRSTSRRRGSKKKRALWITLLVIFLCIFIFAAYMFAQQYLGLLNEKNKLNELSETVHAAAEKEEEPKIQELPEPPAWAPPSTIEQHARQVKKGTSKRRGSKKKKALWITLLVIFLCVFIFAAYMFAQQYLGLLSEKNKLNELSETVQAAAEKEEEPKIQELPEKTEPEPEPEPEEHVVLAKYAELAETNSDMIGWLKINGTVIDYPVMYTPEDPEYYLRRDFDGEYSSTGMLFVDANCDIVDGDNQLIYGHNMKNTAMFGTLDNYATKEFWNDHQYIHYDSLYEEHVYQVVFAFKAYIRMANEEGFRYYRFYGSNNEQEFNDYINNVRELALYDTGVEVEYGDKLISLSTCSYHTEDGRFVVVAKQVF